VASDKLEFLNSNLNFSQLFRGKLIFLNLIENQAPAPQMRAPHANPPVLIILRTKPLLYMAFSPNQRIFLLIIYQSLPHRTS